MQLKQRLKTTRKKNPKPSNVIIEHTDNMGIVATDKALSKIYEILNENINKAAIRFIVKDGGCSGKKYDIALDDSVESKHLNLGWKIITAQSEVVFMKHILIDENSKDMFQNMTIDYEKTDLGEKFIFTNPNATNSCACGKSFG